MVDDFSSMSVVFENPKISREKVSSGEKDKRKVWITFFKNKMEQHTCRLSNYKLYAKNSQDNVFRRKPKTSKVPRNIFRGFQLK